MSQAAKLKFGAQFSLHNGPREFFSAAPQEGENYPRSETVTPGLRRLDDTVSSLSVNVD